MKEKNKKSTDLKTIETKSAVKSTNDPAPASTKQLPTTGTGKGTPESVIQYMITNKPGNIWCSGIYYIVFNLTAQIQEQETNKGDVL